jgi:hypothetical protein
MRSRGNQKNGHGRTCAGKENSFHRKTRERSELTIEFRTMKKVKSVSYVRSGTSNSTRLQNFQSLNVTQRL